MEIKTVKVEIGDIFCSTWGYEQTNVDHFIVVRVTEKTVWLQLIGNEVVEECGWACAYVKPYPERIIGEPFRRKLSYYTSGVYVSINSYASAHLVDKDTKTLQTSYH
jgi:hypothetical protein